MKSLLNNGKKKVIRPSRIRITKRLSNIILKLLNLIQKTTVFTQIEPSATIISTCSINAYKIAILVLKSRETFRKLTEEKLLPLFNCLNSVKLLWHTKMRWPSIRTLQSETNCKRQKVSKIITTDTSKPSKNNNIPRLYPVLTMLFLKYNQVISWRCTR